jgi:hypothetical protein
MPRSGRSCPGAGRPRRATPRRPCRPAARRGSRGAASFSSALASHRASPRARGFFTASICVSAASNRGERGGRIGAGVGRRDRCRVGRRGRCRVGASRPVPRRASRPVQRPASGLARSSPACPRPCPCSCTRPAPSGARPLTRTARRSRIGHHDTSDPAAPGRPPRIRPHGRGPRVGHDLRRARSRLGYHPRDGLGRGSGGARPRQARRRRRRPRRSTSSSEVSPAPRPRPCRPRSAATTCAGASAPAAWAWSTRRTIRSSSARWRSRCCAGMPPATASWLGDCIARPRRSRGSRTPTSWRCTTSASRPARSTW